MDSLLSNRDGGGSKFHCSLISGGLGVKAEQFGFGSNKLHLIFLTIHLNQVEEDGQVFQGGGEKPNVICLANGTHDLSEQLIAIYPSLYSQAQVHSQLGPLCYVQLLVIYKTVDPVTRTATLLHPLGVPDGAHHLPVPLHIGQPVPQPLVQVHQPLVLHASLPCTPDGMLNHYQIKGRLGIE